MRPLTSGTDPVECFIYLQGSRGHVYFPQNTVLSIHHVSLDSGDENEGLYLP